MTDPNRTPLDAVVHFLRMHAMIATGLVSLAAVGAWLLRVGWTDSALFLFLPYNLVLGWIPLPLALVAAWAMRRGWRITSLVVLGAWLVWVPNSAYLVTDLVHLRSRPGIPHVYDSAMCAAFAAAGVLAGLASTSIVARAIEDALAERLERWTSWSDAVARALVDLCLPVVFVVIGLGVWCGRYLRWNTWDLLVHPKAVVHSIVDPALAGSTHLWGITLSLGVGLWVSWLALQSLVPRRASAVHTPRRRRVRAATAHSPAHRAPAAR